MSATPTLSTPRLLLRPATVEDAPAVQALFSSWEVIQHMSLKVPWPFPPDGAIHWLRDIAMPKVARGEVMLWALTLRELGDQAIGILEWRRSDTGDSDGRGFWIAPAYQGRGLMTEAVVAFQDYVFFEEGVERLVV
ncbi:MAG: GNAT family N-acetyltransferase, partial [Deltaproteobacteria bacterium]|nr:GNAT family N-acetyltransferase [Deltaproteobacteria bacterium]